MVKEKKLIIGCMEILDIKYKQLEKACSRLECMIKKLTARRSAKSIDPMELMAYRDSVVRRFECYYEPGWKFMKLFLRERFSIITQSPKETFRECLNQRLISSDEAESLIKMIEDRNAASHTYDEDMSDLIAERVAAHYNTICIVADRFMHSLDLSKHSG